jgi:hypothetical protein
MNIRLTYSRQLKVEFTSEYEQLSKSSESFKKKNGRIMNFS